MKTILEKQVMRRGSINIHSLRKSLKAREKSLILWN